MAKTDLTKAKTMDPIVKDAIKMAELSLDEDAKSLVKDVVVTT